MEQPAAHRTAADELSSHRSVAIFIVTIVFLITSTTSIILRLVAKHMNRAKLLAEDYVILVAQVSLQENRGDPNIFILTTMLRFFFTAWVFLCYWVSCKHPTLVTGKD